MKVYVLIISNSDMRPRSDIMTTAVFAKREDALATMERDIEGAIENEQISDSEVERNSELDYAASADGRFVWKIEERVICGAVNEKR